MSTGLLRCWFILVFFVELSRTYFPFGDIIVYLILVSYCMMLSIAMSSKLRREQTHLTVYVPSAKTRDPKKHTSDAPRFIVLAPNLLRTDRKESVYLEAQGVSSTVQVTIRVMDFPLKAQLLLLDTLELGPHNGFNTLKTLELSSDLLNREDTKNKFVYLHVEFGHYYRHDEVVMVTLQKGYIFIQTDKPIYNPGDTVMFRYFLSTPAFQSVEDYLTVQLENADGVTVHQKSVRATNGVYPDNFKLPDHVNEGKWKVIAKFDTSVENTFTAEFEVKKYVLPAFNVTLTPKKSFFSVDDTELEVEITASYLYGKSVKGTAYVVFGVERDNLKKRLPTVKQITELDPGTVTLTMAEIQAAYPDIRLLVGSSFYIKASVMTESGSDLVEAMKFGIKIVDSPYVISFRDTQKYFKPGLPFLITAQVSHHDGSPAENIPVQLTSKRTEDLTLKSGTLQTSVTMSKDDEVHTITVETKVEGLKAEQQARQQITVFPYQAFDQRSQNYLYLSVSHSSLSKGDTFTLTATVAAADDDNRKLITHLTYLVLTKGGILVAKRLDIKDQFLTSTTMTVTMEMMPSFRVVAFYTLPWAGRMEVVADSVWVDVMDTCVGELTVGPAPGSLPVNYEPKNSLEFQIRGDPGASVSLVAVDNAVYLLNKQRLNQKKLWDVVEQGDLGCTRGGGQTSTGVFTDAGLLFFSNTGDDTPPRQALQCPGRSRRKRSAELLKVRAELDNLYKEQLQRRCCADGMLSVPMPYSCTRRSLYITEDWDACVLPFRRCCARYWGQEFDDRRPHTTAPPPTTAPITTEDEDGLIHLMGVGRHYTIASTFLSSEFLTSGRPEISGRHYAPVMPQGPEDEDMLDVSDVSLRVQFFESWMWRDLKLPTTPGHNGLASLSVKEVLPDSITEWGILAISSSTLTGFCVADPYKVKVSRSFFVDLRLPHSVARNEHVEIKAVVYNYRNADMEVRVVLAQTVKICSLAYHAPHTQNVRVPAGSSVAVPFTLVPLEAGSLTLEVAALDRHFPTGDRVQKKLRVVVEGVERTKIQTFILDPAAKGDSDGKQVVTVEKVDLQSLVPNSKPETRVNIIGSPLADALENSLSSDSLASLIRMPGGCVEQNLAGITLPLIANLYLDRSNDWAKVGVQRKKDAIDYITRGYERQLMYRKKDDSYPPYRNEGTSTWITAYVVKVFSMASRVREVRLDEQHVCGPVLYLLNNKQLHNGAFREDNPVYDTYMTGGLRGAEAQTTLASFIFIALSEATAANMKCGSLEAGMSKTASYLRSMLPVVVRPYTVAITSYALSLVDPPSSYREHLLKAAAPDRSHWPDSDSHLFTLEATGYALLALVRGSIQDAHAPFRWLNEQRGRGGGYGSTQPTMVVLQALSQYLTMAPPLKDPTMLVNIKVAGRSDLAYQFTSENKYLSRSSKVPLDQGFSVEAKGQGQGVMEVVTYYNELPEVTANASCDHFHLDVILAESSETPPADALKTYTITINTRALGPREVRMVVLDISLPSGFTPENSDLDRLTNSVDRYINNFDVVDNLRDRASLIIHLFKLSNSETETISFRIHQNFKVSHLQPSPVYIYQYYNPEHNCTRFYNLKENLEQLARVCTDDFCRCTQGDCCVSKIDVQTIPEGEREAQGCMGLQHILKVKVVDITLSQYDRYEVEVLKIIKLGVEQVLQVGQRRVFLSHSGCRGGLNMQEGEYLIMGPMTDVWYKDGATKSSVYMLGKNTWVERWPTPAECSADGSLQPRCSQLAQAFRDIMVEGCRV